MEVFNQLELITEISATLLGFVAVFLALSNKDGRFRESDRHFVQALVLNSSYCIVLGLAPRALSFLFESTFWVLSLGIAAVGGLIVAIVMAWTQWHMSENEKNRVHFLWHVPPWGLATAITVLVLAGFIYQDHAHALYANAATVSVGIAIWCFIAVVFRRFF